MIETEKQIVDLSLWKQVLHQVIDGSASPERASGLLNSASVEKLDSQIIILSFPNALTKSGVDRSYVEPIKDAYYGLTNFDVDIVTKIGDSSPDHQNVIDISQPLMPEVSPSIPTFHVSEKQKLSSNLSDSMMQKFTFENFIVGESNNFAYSAAKAVAEAPGSRTDHNPLFIYGHSGLGKTHLLCAIANYISRFYPDLSVGYFQAKELLDDLISMRLENNWTLFDQKYTSLNVLLIDDIQFLEGKKESIERVFQLLEKFVMNNQSIIFSADRSPRELDMDERMQSRFMRGLPVDILPPTFETKFGIIKNYVNKYMDNIEMDDDIIGYIAEISTSNIREIEGALNRINTYFNIRGGSKVTIDQVKDILRDFFPETGSKKIKISTIQKEVERYFSISHDEMIGQKRERRINTPRQVAMYLSRTLTDESYPQIGRNFGGRDHTTIMNGVTNIEKQIKENYLLYDQMEHITQSIKDKS